MKNYTITVNGKAYDVTVEEKENTGSFVPPVRRTPVVNTPEPTVQQAPPVQAGGNVKIEAKAAGKVFKIEAKPGMEVKPGDTIIILEVMKMETPVVAPVAGTIASIQIAVGDAVESGTLLATLNN
ncbi:MAG: biotin/lipoyl-containing protein [Lachnospiraceae bacterium]